MPTLLKAPMKVLDRMTEEEFFWFCTANPEMRLERNSQGQILFMAPTGSETGIFDSALTTELHLWNRNARLGRVFGSSAGFTLPDGSVKSADVAWMAAARWAAVPADDRRRFAHVCPDFVAEIKSPSDSWPELQAKMLQWTANGCRLGWLLDPDTERIELYMPAHVSPGDWRAADGGEVLPGLRIDLHALFA